MYDAHVLFEVFGERLCFAQESSSGALDVVDCIIPEIAPFLGSIATVAWPASRVFCSYLEECCKRRALRSADCAWIPSPGTDDNNDKRTALRTALDVDDSLDNFPERRLMDKDLIDFDGTNVLELGSGIGVCGIAVRRLTDAKTVTITDVVNALPLMERNWHSVLAAASAASSSSPLRCELSIEALQWGVDAVSATSWRSRAFDIIIGSDLLYQLESHDALFDTLEHFFALNPRCVFILSHKKRQLRESEFFVRLRRAQFRVRDALRSLAFAATAQFRREFDETFALLLIWREPPRLSP